MCVGEEISRYDEATGGEILDAGWSEVDITKYECRDDDILIEWLRDNNVDVDNEVRWHYKCVFYFRRSEDAMAFKLKWS